MYTYMNLETVGPWIAQLIVAVFFIVGFIDIYMAIWHTAFRNIHSGQAKRVTYRVLLIVLSVGVSSVLHFAGYNSGNNAMMYHNIGLFILVFSLLDEDINFGEYFIRSAAIVIVWTMHHVSGLTSWKFLISMAILLVMLVIIRRYRNEISLNLEANIVTFAILDLDFWLTLPLHSAGIAVSGVVDGEAILMFLLMTIFTWRQYHITVRNNHISHIANYDTMTDTKNYTAYQRDIFNLVGIARTNQQPLTLAVFDIDRFKQVNDQYGHLAGNIILTGISTIIQRILEQYSHEYQLYRTGGEEFAIIFPNSTKDEIIPVLIHCWRAVREQKFDYNTEMLNVTVSMGMSSLRATDESVDELYKRADDSLYDSKGHGRDTITVDGKEQNLTDDADNLTYAYFVQSIYDTKSGINHVANELTLHCYDHREHAWIDPPRGDLNIDKRIKLIQDALINSACKSIVISLSTAEFLSLKVTKKVINFRKSVDGPDKLFVELDRLPTVESLKQMMILYHQGDIKVMLSHVGNNRHFEQVSPGLELIDGIKLTMQSLRDRSSESLKDNIQFWGRIANKWHIDFVLDGVLNEQEAKWVPTQNYITYVEGDFFDHSRLPISA
ncbi:diguanylate cyclase [Pediococcus ethanolidurans]|uniref:GGDEF domain-containing protein n=1 Tax=Pediococcus ethanolidurans TaxID=319653 RepID=UPI002954992D|nr:GGDEF domain-containing protein [Pediococcus ethanolidurans]MDV7718445.1 diguanylate cyclase [Pediococcus ethanolidurans]